MAKENITHPNSHKLVSVLNYKSANSENKYYSNLQKWWQCIL